jgi:predicted Zn-dependent protease
MKSIQTRILVFLALLNFSTLAHAQFGNILKGVDKINEKKKEIDDKRQEWNLSEQDEVRLGEKISAKVRETYGVAQDPDVHKYVTLVGTALAKNSSRSKLAWHFIVLDTDGVNAFAAPGGYIHITRGALAMLKSESELAGVLAHELTHVTAKHTLRALQENKGLQIGAKAANLQSDPALLQRMADEGTKIVFAGYGRTEELQADSEGVVLAAKTGYEPAGLRKFLGALNDRNKDSDAKQGLFASHPEMNERLQKLDAAIAAQKSDAMAVLAERYTMHVKYQPVALAAIAVADGTKGLTDDSGGKKDDQKNNKKEDEKKGSRFGLSSLKNAAAGGSDSKQSASVTGSGGSRGVDRELTAKGGSNPAPVAVTITDAELAEFIKSGNLRS